MNRKASIDTPELRLIDTEDDAPQETSQKDEEDDSREVKVFRQDALYWRVRALDRELVATYDNVQSLLLALRDVIALTVERIDHSDGEDVQTLLGRIRERASVTLQAIEGIRKGEDSQ